MISEKDYVLKEFGKRFAGSEDLRFLVHGSREYAAAILDAYADRFRFDALTTFDGIREERFRGVPVISRGEAARQIADGGLELEGTFLTMEETADAIAAALRNK